MGYDVLNVLHNLTCVFRFKAFKHDDVSISGCLSPLQNLQAFYYVCFVSSIVT